MTAFFPHLLTISTLDLFDRSHLLTTYAIDEDTLHNPFLPPARSSTLTPGAHYPATSTKIISLSLSLVQEYNSFGACAYDPCDRGTDLRTCFSNCAAGSPALLRTPRSLPHLTLTPSKPILIFACTGSFVSNHSTNTSFLICEEEFFEDNPLIAATLQPRTQHKYAIALEKFRASPLATLDHNLPLDHPLCIYIQDPFTRNPNPGKRQEMSNLICMLLIMYPFLRGGYLGLSRRCISGWRALRPARSYAPFTQDITLAIAWRLLALHHTEAAVAVLIIFCACLRVLEALSLQIQDIALLGDARIAGYGPHTAGLNIRDAKTTRYTGRLLFVKLENPQTIKFLEAWVASTKRQAGPLLILTYQTYAAQLKDALSSLGLQHARFTSHSARIGKATHDYISGLSVGQIAINGSWKSINSLRYYVTNGRAWLLDTHIPPAAQNRINDAAQNTKCLIKALALPHTRDTARS